MSNTIVCISDLHGHLPDIPECDLLLIGGDICPDYGIHRVSFQRQWLDYEFRHWLNNVPAETIIGTWGNHDWVAEDGVVPNDLPGTWLIDAGVTWGEDYIYCSPYTPEFMGWAFMEEDRRLAQRWAKIPERTTILMTHGPPLGSCGMTGSGEDAGSASLAMRLLELPNLKLHVVGHIHEGRGSSGITMNVSHVDKTYDPIHDPVVIHDW